MAERNNFSSFLDILKGILSQIQNVYEEGPLTDNRSASLDALENLSVKMDEACDTLVVLLNGLNPTHFLWELIFQLLQTFFALKQYIDEENNQLQNAESFVQPSSVLVSSTTCGEGRPRYDINEEQVLFLRSKHFTWTKIAQILRVSDRTLRRKRQNFTVLEQNFSNISDADLCKIVESIRLLTPNIGQTRLLGALRCRGLRIQRWRVRNCLRKLDPIDTALRGHVAIYRRKYSVPYPNYLWHLDGNHKLIRWRMVVHACIDGFSRLIIYLSCQNNNLASTVYSLFQRGVSAHGLPKKIRTDHGMENVHVARYMLQHRGTNRGSVLTGRSVHNVRVERLHRDVYSGVLCHYALLFNFMEEEHLLDIDNEQHLLALQLVFIPQINKSLEEFVKQWNSHPVSSAGHQSPEQMFIAGSLNAASDQHECENSNEVFDNTIGSGIADDEQSPETGFAIYDEDYAIIVSQIELSIPSTLNSQQFLSDDGNYGIYHYVSCLQEIHEHEQHSE